MHLHKFICKQTTIEKNHPYTFDVYNNIADLHEAKGDLKSAFIWKYKSVRGFEKHFGTKHPDTAEVYNNIATLCIEMEEYKMAVQYAKLALPTYLRYFGEDHFTTKNVKLIIDDYSKL